MKKVILVGCVEPWEHEKHDAEIWCVNLAYRDQLNCDRVYAADCLYPGDRSQKLGQDFIDDMNVLGCDVVGQRHYPELPRSRPYDMAAADAFFGFRYYTSTMAYMMADAIREGASVIVLHRILPVRKSTEYFAQKPCLDFWAGYALGRGIRVVKSSDSLVMAPWPWETATYGYTWGNSQDVAEMTMASVVNGLMSLDHRHFWPDPETERQSAAQQEAAA